MRQVISADWLLTSEGFPQQLLMSDVALVIEDGWIKERLPIERLSGEDQKRRVHYAHSLLCPGFVNSHNHSFQSLLKGFCDDADFFTWRDQALYKYATVLSREDLYTGALFAFAEMLKAGITTVCDFFYINDQGNDNARAIMQAAEDLGIRLVFARTLYDWDGAPARFRETIDQALDNTQALMEEINPKYAHNKLFSVLPAPHSLHGASLPLIQAGRDLASQYDTKFHMHIAEGQYERQMMLDKYGLSPIRYLYEHDLLNERLVGIHCVWLDDADIALMARQQSALSYNPSSNMFLGDGITRLREMLEAGISVSLGTDGGCSNNRASIIEEMRMASLLQKVKWCDATVSNAEDMIISATLCGASALNLPIGSLSINRLADITVVDLNDLSMQPTQNMVKNLVYASQPSAIKAVYVHGRKVQENGQLLGVPEAKVLEKVRHTTKNWR